MSNQVNDRGGRLWKKLRKVGTLSSGEWLCMLKAAVMLSAAKLALKLVSFKTLLAFLEQSGPESDPPVRSNPVSPDQAAYLIGVVSRYHPLKPRCLERALVLYVLLRRNGIEAELRIGTRKMEGEFQAHAWIEQRGQVLGGLEGYAPLPRFAKAAKQRQLA